MGERRDSDRRYYEANRERIRDKQKEYQLRRKEEIRAQRKEYRALNAKAISEAKRQYREANREKISATLKVWYAANREAELVKSRERRYGLTLEQFNQLLESQSHQCAICTAPITKSSHVDHCHRTGKVRGILCGKCNAGLGMFGDSPERIEKAVSYLRRQ